VLIRVQASDTKSLGQVRSFALTSLAPLIIPIAQPEFVKARMNENPLLKVPPASRGNRTGARLGSPREAGGTCRRGAIMNSGSVIGIRVQRFGTKSLKQGLLFPAQA